MLPVGVETVKVSIRSAAHGRGECMMEEADLNFTGVSIRSAAHGRGEFTCQRTTTGVNLFQSAPRHMAAENSPLFTAEQDYPGFNPLRGTWPRRIRRDCTRGPRSCVSIRSAAHGRGECSTYRRSMISFPFQSAPRHMAAENGPILLDLPNRGSFNPLRGTWPRRMLWLSPTDQCQNVSIRSAAHGRGECSCYNSSPTMHFMGGFREHRFQQGACLRNPRSTYA